MINRPQHLDLMETDIPASNAFQGNGTHAKKRHLRSFSLCFLLTKYPKVHWKSFTNHQFVEMNKWCWTLLSPPPDSAVLTIRPRMRRTGTSITASCILPIFPCLSFAELQVPPDYRQSWRLSYSWLWAIRQANDAYESLYNPVSSHLD